MERFVQLFFRVVLPIDDSSSCSVYICLCVRCRSNESPSRRSSQGSSYKRRTPSLYSSSSTAAAAFRSRSSAAAAAAAMSGDSSDKSQGTAACDCAGPVVDAMTTDFERDQFIIVHSNVSTCSSMSLAGSRSSRTSSSINSFFWNVSEVLESQQPLPLPENGSSSSSRLKLSRNSEGILPTPSALLRREQLFESKVKESRSRSMLEVSRPRLCDRKRYSSYSSNGSGSRRRSKDWIESGERRRPSWTCTLTAAVEDLGPGMKRTCSAATASRSVV